MGTKKFITLITEADDFSEKALSVYKSLGPVYLYPKLQGAAKERIKAAAHILVIALKYQIDKTWIDSMPDLKLIVSPTTGLNHIDMDYCRKRAIKVISLRGRRKFLKNIPSTAEAAMALLLALTRNIPWAFEDVKRGHWNRVLWRGRQLLGKTLGILGFGRLGKITARYAKTFGMKVIAHDPYVSEKIMEKAGVHGVNMDELFKQSDVVSLHVMLTPETHNLVKEKHLKLMKPTAYFVNTARSELLERDLLYKALRNGWIAGAATDVLWDERSDGSHLRKDALWNYAQKNKNLIIVPHIGGATYEAMEITQNFVAELALKFFRVRPQ